ncbi:hypothetical protein A4H96_12310 [Acidithiobacillus ferrooxidans]|uniref:Uncharacterized protein n=3 Tax=Acidithiobacillus TaxID=119977 RepID=A0A179B7Q8_ACIFR|nr:hypothetical protein A4H96_12310 [Acidithiobacillus ferrooxidans]
MIVALAGVFSPLLDVEGMKGKAMPLSSYELVAAETGEGKSTVMSAIFDPINRVSAELTALRQIEWVGGRMLWSGYAPNRS